MRFSQLFTKTFREKPKDAVVASHILLIRGGFIAQLSSGIYSFLPLGFRVLKNIEKIIREELDKIGALEVSVPILHPAEIWKKTGRWDEIGKELWKIKNREGEDMVLSMTHEEAMAEMASMYIQKAADLPLLLNQFQVKFRDEERPRGGLLRLKEFIMQDAYSFDRDDDALDVIYKKVLRAYLNIFKRLELSVIPVEASSGVMGGNESHEFMLVAEAGEDKVFVCDKCGYAINTEAIKNKKCPRCKNNLTEKRAIELGHTFKLGLKYSKAFDIKFEDIDKKKQLTVMGSYGIGLDRTMAAIVETNYDEQGIIWPESVAPFKMHLIAILGKEDGEKVKKVAEKIYQDLMAAKVDVLYDDREDKTPGEKFADADLIGCPIRMVVSKRTLEKNSVEIKKRNANNSQLVSIDKLQSIMI